MSLVKLLRSFTPNQLKQAIANRRLSGRNYRSRSAQGAWDFQKLEPRQLLAGISLQSRIVLLDGSGADDVASITQVNSSTIRVSLSGFSSEEFSTSQFDEVIFRGRNGDDTFTNNTEVFSRAFGHAGNDRFTGGQGRDLFQGGGGDDVLIGRGGNDGLRGNSGNDEIRGGDATDHVYGGSGTDEIFGENGNDRLAGGDGNDIIIGGNDNDSIFGNAGDDTLDGENGDDVLTGGNGNDTILAHRGSDIARGGDGNDIITGQSGTGELFGDSGDDQITGGSLADMIFGGGGNDVLSGGAGNDQIFGGDGNDTIRGDAGDDRIGGFNGDDILSGGDGDDLLLGESGSDTINGGSGDDDIRGGNGNDILRGDGGVDTLSGDSGRDSLFGGIGLEDILSGGSGSDRFWIEGSFNDSTYEWTQRDRVLDAGGGDAQLRLDRVSSTWTNAEIEVLDEGAAISHALTPDNARLLRSTLSDDPIVVQKFSASDSDGPELARNRLITVIENGVTSYHRQIHFSDWNAGNATENENRVRALVHEFAHNWDSIEEIEAVVPGAAGLWTEFLAQSGWRSTNPNSSAYTYAGQSNGVDWWYLTDSEFAYSYSRNNPREDWATTWEFALELAGNEAGRERLADKIAVVEEFIARI